MMTSVIDAMVAAVNKIENVLDIEKVELKDANEARAEIVAAIDQLREVVLKHWDRQQAQREAHLDRMEGPRLSVEEVIDDKLITLKKPALK